MKVKFGIMGLGGIAHRFAKALKMVDAIELTGVASSDINRARQFAGEYGVRTYYGDYQSLAADPLVDVIYIAQTHDRHYELIKLCIEHGKGVLCEKPMVLTKQHAVEISQLSKQHNVLVMEAMWSSFLPTFQKAKEWIAEDRIGTVKLVQASFCYNFPYDPKHRLYNPQTAGGSLYDAGVYPIEFTTNLLGEQPVTVKAAATFCETGVDDYIAISMKFQSGALASLSCGLRAKTSQDAYVYGSHGHIVVREFLSSHKIELYDNEGQLSDTYEASFAEGFCFEIEHFAELFRNGKIESDIMPLANNIGTAAIFDDIMNQIQEDQ